MWNGKEEKFKKKSLLSINRDVICQIQISCNSFIVEATP